MLEELQFLFTESFVIGWVIGVYNWVVLSCLLSFSTRFGKDSTSWLILGKALNHQVYDTRCGGFRLLFDLACDSNNIRNTQVLWNLKWQKHKSVSWTEEMQMDDGAPSLLHGASGLGNFHIFPLVGCLGATFRSCKAGQKVGASDGDVQDYSNHLARVVWTSNTYKHSTVPAKGVEGNMSTTVLRLESASWPAPSNNCRFIKNIAKTSGTITLLVFESAITVITINDPAEVLEQPMAPSYHEN